MPFPVDVAFITAAERELGLKFPASFVTRMTRQNGGELVCGAESWDLFPFFDTSDRTRISRTCNDIVRETRAARKRPGFPTDAVAIGTNGCGDLLILLPQSATPNALRHDVLWWDHETDQVTCLADDFADLESR